MSVITVAVVGDDPRELENLRQAVEANGFQSKLALSGNGGSLTQRQEEVLRLIVRGHSNKEVGAELTIGLDAVKSHTRHIYEALQMHSRAEFIAWWHGNQDEK